MSKKLIKYFFIILFLYIKMPNKCYSKNKEKLWKKACERYQNLSEKKKTKKKNKKQKKTCERCQNFTAEKKASTLSWI